MLCESCSEERLCNYHLETRQSTHEFIWKFNLQSIPVFFWWECQDPEIPSGRINTWTYASLFLNFVFDPACYVDSVITPGRESWASSGWSASLALSGVQKWHTTVTLNRESGLQERTRGTDLAAYFLLGTWMCKMKERQQLSQLPVGYSEVQEEAGGGSCPQHHTVYV